jgi:hypothetical protein
MPTGRLLAAIIAVLVVGASVAASDAAPAPAAHAERPRVLVTGDSSVMFTDEVLRRTLHASRAARVTLDRHVATGLAKPWLLRWERHAAWQARRRRPDVVITSMGANDIHPIGRSQCCAAGWVRAYAGRIGRLARVWRRGGARRVYWLTLPIQAHARLEPLFTAVNLAVERAHGIEVIDVRPVVNPSGRYHHELEVAPGVVEQIRHEDGVHLSQAGAELVAAAVVARLRADGILPAR